MHSRCALREIDDDVSSFGTGHQHDHGMEQQTLLSRKIDAWMNGQMDGWIDGWMDDWMDE
jgi:hypothetical protein